MSGKDAKGGSMAGTPDRENNETFEGYAVLELMGHRRLAGWVTEQEIAGAGMLRIDVYDGDAEEAAVTQFYSPFSLYALTPCSEKIARSVGARTRPAPVSRYEMEPPKNPPYREEYPGAEDAEYDMRADDHDDDDEEESV